MGKSINLLATHSLTATHKNRKMGAIIPCERSETRNPENRNWIPAFAGMTFWATIVTILVSIFFTITQVQITYADETKEIGDTLTEFGLKGYVSYATEFKSLTDNLDTYKSPEIKSSTDPDAIFKIAETIVLNFYMSRDVEEFFLKLVIFANYQSILVENNPEISFSKLDRNISYVTEEFKKMKSTGIIPDKYKDKIGLLNSESVTLFNMWDKQIFSISDEANSVLRMALMMARYRDKTRQIYQRQMAEDNGIFFEFEESDLIILNPILSKIVDDYYDTEDMKTQLLKILVIFSIYFLEQSENGDFFFIPLKEQFDKTWETTKLRNMILVVGAGATSVVLVQVTKRFLLKVPIKDSLVQKLMLKLNGGKPGTISRIMSWLSEKRFISSTIGKERFMTFYNTIPMASGHLTDIFISYWVGEKVGENVLKQVGLIKIDKYQNPVSNMPVDKVVGILLMDAEG